MNVLIIGYGSIGKRHYEILRAIDGVNCVDVVTKQLINVDRTYQKLSGIRNLNCYDYFIIATETVKHFEQLKYICSKVTKKKILVEKPLFDKSYNSFNNDNEVYTAYNLRFHPVLQELRKQLSKATVYSVNAICGQYLPNWRPGQDYRKSYSADIKMGGGVLRDLSHELDYISWLFGNLISFDAINTKISDLEITSDDIFTAIGITEKKTIVNVTLDYISKAVIRRLVIHTKNETVEADVIKSSIVITDKQGKSRVLVVGKEERNYTYEQMHRAILSNNLECVCSYEEGLGTVNIIDNIKFLELK